MKRKTVAEFIEDLKKLPPDAEIVVQGQGGMEGCDGIPDVEPYRRRGDCYLIFTEESVRD